MFSISFFRAGRNFIVFSCSNRTWPRRHLHSRSFYSILLLIYIFKVVTVSCIKDFGAWNCPALHSTLHIFRGRDIRKGLYSCWLWNTPQKWEGFGNFSRPKQLKRNVYADHLPLTTSVSYSTLKLKMMMFSKTLQILNLFSNTYSSKVYYRCQMNVNPQDLCTALFYIRFELKINALAT